MAPVCVLVGPPGAGKTTVGRALAERLGVAFADTDALVEQRTGRTIPDIFVTDGESAFRALERTAVTDALTGFDGVLALGGGAILDPDTRADLAGHPVVFLSVELPAAVQRVGLGVGRPLLKINPRATMKYLMDQRRPLYVEVATHTVATDDRSAQEIADELAARLSAAGGTLNPS